MNFKFVCTMILIGASTLGSMAFAEEACSKKPMTFDYFVSMLQPAEDTIYLQAKNVKINARLRMCNAISGCKAWEAADSSLSSIGLAYEYKISFDEAIKRYIKEVSFQIHDYKSKTMIYNVQGPWTFQNHIVGSTDQLVMDSYLSLVSSKTSKFSEYVENAKLNGYVSENCFRFFGTYVSKTELDGGYNEMEIEISGEF